MRPTLRFQLLIVLTISSFLTKSLRSETLEPLKGDNAPQTHDALWAGFDPRAEPLDVEVLRECEEDGVVIRVLRYRVGLFKGEKVMMAAVYAFPKGGTNLPGLVNIHGGGQFADYRGPLTNAKRGYATISLAWAGRIRAPGYELTSNEVKLYWEAQTDHPKYKVTTDWGALDAYHAPTKNAKNSFTNTAPHPWTLDTVDSPRNNPWFLLALNARRALTFLEQQPEVDPNRLGVYGHSMGGKQTVLTVGADSRVKAAVPSCGGVSDRMKGQGVYLTTINDNISLAKVDCPILFQMPSNDFHGRIDDLQTAVTEIQSSDWRLACSPHHNHQDTADYEVLSQLWFDQYLKGNFEFPSTPELKVSLSGSSGIPVGWVEVDDSKPVLSVDFYYTRQGQVDGLEDDRENTKHRFWHHAEGRYTDGSWVAELPLHGLDAPLWVYANVRYALDSPAGYAGYYYRVGESDSFVISSLMSTASADDLRQSGVRSTIEKKLIIEDFQGDWLPDWFSYQPEEWAITTNKIYDDVWKAPSGATLNLRVSSERSNLLVVRLDQYAATIELKGGSTWESIELSAIDFVNAGGEPLANFQEIRQLELSPKERLKSGRGKDAKSQIFGGQWKGAQPLFADLHWRKAN